MIKFRLSISAILIIAIACSPSNEFNQDDLNGEQLANAYCISCHVFVEPALLPKSQWANVLPLMGNRLGMISEEFPPYTNMTMEEIHWVQSENIFPTQPILTKSAWKKLQDYIISQAPDSFVLPEPLVWEANKLFKASFPKVNLSGFPAITMVEIDEISDKIYIADWNGYLLQLNNDFSIESHIQAPNPIVDIERDSLNKLNLLSIGSLYPSDTKTGAIATIAADDFNAPQLVLSQLGRPVYFTKSDIDGDNIEDLIVCGFGNIVGKFSWFKKTPSGYQENIIKNVPGATRVFSEDLDKDGDNDLIALLAQGDEGVSIFYNENASFREIKVLRFHPIYGSSDFEFLDFDLDGYKDIILANGDNGDKTNTLKPYHGVRIFINDGSFNFKEKFFFPLYGASKVRSRDFDLDGDIDLIAMSFFPDYKNALSQSLVYLENQGDWKFIPHEIDGAKDGRWMVMDAGDLDNDGDVDIVLGSFILSSVGIDKNLLDNWRNSEKRLLYLENLHIK